LSAAEETLLPLQLFDLIFGFGAGDELIDIFQASIRWDIEAGGLLWEWLLVQLLQKLRRKIRSFHHLLL
jgi:hypothetical protein